ncbi:unnamed protein product, partial [Amoebophrya sp. A120]
KDHGHHSDSISTIMSAVAPEKGLLPGEGRTTEEEVKGYNYQAEATPRPETIPFPPEPPPAFLQPPRPQKNAAAARTYKIKDASTSKGSSGYNSSGNPRSSAASKNTAASTTAWWNDFDFERLVSDLLQIQALSAPNVISFFLLLLPETLNVIAISIYAKSNPYALPAVGLGNCFFNCLAVAFPVGLNCGLDTLVSTAFGAKAYKEMYVYLAQAQICVFLYSIFA